MDSIIFDVDGTLWDSTEVIAKAWETLVKEKYDPQMQLTPKILKSHFGKTLPNIARDLFIGIPEAEQLALIEECCAEEHKALLATPPAVYDGLEAALKELSKKYSLFIVSNCQAGYIEVFLEATGLGKYFKDHLCPGDTGREKGDNIKEIISRNQLKEAVYVGDTMGDWRATQEAGIPFVYAAYGFGQVEEPDWTISKPMDLLNIF